MRRILFVLTVALVMVAMLLMAVPVFAQGPPDRTGPIGASAHNPNCSGFPLAVCTVPAADVWPNEGDEAGFVDRSKAEVADGGAPPPKGGSPGADNFSSECLKNSESC